MRTYKVAKRWARTIGRCLVVSAVGCLLASCGGAGPKAAPVASSGLVSGRAPEAEQVDANGIELRGSGSLNVHVNGHSIEISAHDWDTIVSSSSVQHRIGVTLDAAMRGSQTTRNRFQYLADLMARYFAVNQLGTVGIIALPRGRSLTAITALFNNSATVYGMTDERLTITVSPPLLVIGHKRAFEGTNAPVIVPAGDVYFLYQTLPLVRDVPASQTTEGFNISWTSHACGAAC